MKKDVVKYKNEMNELILKDFHAVDLDVFMLICSKVKDRQNELLKLPFTELKKAVGLSHESNKKFCKSLNQMATKLKRVGGSYNEEGQFYEFNLFSDFYGTTIDVTANNEKTQKAYELYGEVPKNTLVVSVNPRCSFLLNDFKQYTRFDLSDFVKLESKYSKNLFRLLKQYRRTGKYRVNAERFRELMACPASYPNKEFMRVCVNVAVNELSRGYFNDLKVEPVHGEGRGKPIVAYEFTFKKSNETPGQYSLNDYMTPEVQEKKKTGTAKKSNNRFNNFEQREYDWEKLEKELLTIDVKPKRQPER